MFILDNFSDEFIIKGSTIIVDAGGHGNYTTIQAAIDNASAGDTIYVWAGWYNENININKTLTIIGNGTANTTINGTGIGDVVHISADWVNISGFTIINSGGNGDDAGIKLENVENCKMFNNNCSENKNGIFMIFSNGSSIFNNSFLNNELDAISIKNSTIIEIFNNTMKNSGIYLSGAALDQFIHIINNNTINNKNIYYYKNLMGITVPFNAGEVILVNCSNFIIENTLFENSSIGIELAFSYNNIMKNNRFTNNTRDGVELLFSWNNTIEKNIFINNNLGGLGLLESNNNIILDNTLNGNIYGIKLLKSNSNTIRNNNYTFQSTGIYLLYSSNNTMISNNCSFNIFGIELLQSNNNSITNSIIENESYHGIRLIDSNNNNIINNTVQHNIGDGIFIQTSSNNSFMKNYLYNNSNGIYTAAISGYTYNRLKISSNNCSNNNIYGIMLNYLNNSIIDKNNCIFNGEDGIYSIYALNSNITNNNCSNNLRGIQFFYPSSNLFFNNICQNNTGVGLYLVDATDNILNNNYCTYNNSAGITIDKSNDIILLKNHCNNNKGNGILISQSFNLSINDNICNNNAFEAFYLGLKISSINNNSASGNDVGIYLSSAIGNNIERNNLSNNIHGIYLDHSDHNNFLWDKTENNDYGFSISQSPGNIINNCSILYNTKNDISLTDSGKNNTLINSSFSSISFSDYGSEFIVKNYLHIRVNDTLGNPVSGVDVKVLDNISTVYSTPGFGGSQPKTNSAGQVRWLLVTDRILNKTGNKDNVTTIAVKYPSYIFHNTPRDVDMGTSHFEYFSPNDKPQKSILNSPTNNSYLNDATPRLTWQAGVDKESDPLTYFVEVDDWGGDWQTLITSNHTGSGIIMFDVSSALSDGRYQWRIRANDGYENGSWSNVWNFEIDIDMPVANKPNIFGQFNNTGTIRWWWTPSTDTGSGIVGYNVFIGTTPTGSDVVNGEFITVTWYQRTGLANGKTYYCRIKAKNGAGTVGDFSPSSTGVFVDLEVPTANRPLSPSQFNNSGTVRWTWAKSYNTGSGIVGYYVYVGTTPDGYDQVDGEFTVDTKFQVSGLVDAKTYYCRVKAKNGAGTIGEFSPSSTGILVDLDSPISTTPSPPGKYNNTGRIKWTWQPVQDTGSGILGYYVTVSKDTIVTTHTIPTEDIVISDAWTTQLWFEAGSLEEGFVYYCHIKTKNGAGTIGAFSEGSTGIIIDTTPPRAPTAVLVNPPTWTRINKFNITWTNPTDISGIAGVYYKLDTTPKNERDGVFIEGAGINKITEITVEGDGEHSIYIWLKDHAENVLHKNHATSGIYLDITAPSAPISVLVTPNSWSSINSYTIDWTTPVDLSGVKTGCYYYNGTDELTSQLQGIWTDDKPLTINASSNGESTVYIWLEDIAGNKDFKFNDVAKLKLDTIPPKINHTKVTLGAIGKELLITAEVTDTFAGVDSVTLCYKITTQGNYTTLTMKPEFGTSIFSAEIPGNAVTSSGLEYYIKTTDSSNPKNIIYFGYFGETNIAPNAGSDINIQVPVIPKILAKSPMGKYIPITSKINITFNKPMDKSTIYDAFKITPITSGSFTWNGTNLIFIPFKPLLYDTEYTVKLTTAAKDSEGYSIDQNVSWTFRTALPPEIDDTNNDQGAEDQIIFYGITILLVIIIILVILLLLIRKKKKDEERRKIREAEEKEKLKSPFELKLSEKGTKTFHCPNCGATIMDQNNCSYCGWSKQI